MNLSELTERLSKKTGASKALSHSIMKEFMSAVQSEVKKGNRVTLVGFGTFERVERKARKARNPSTGDEFRVPQRKLPKFKPGKNFKELISGKGRAKPKLKAKKATARKTAKAS